MALDSSPFVLVSDIKCRRYTHLYHLCLFVYVYVYAYILYCMYIYVCVKPRHYGELSTDVLHHAIPFL